MSGANGDNLQRLVRKIVERWMALDEGCEYPDVPIERIETMLTEELRETIAYCVALEDLVDADMLRRAQEMIPANAPAEARSSLQPDVDERIKP